MFVRITHLSFSKFSDKYFLVCAPIVSVTNFEINVNFYRAREKQVRFIAFTVLGT